MSPFVVFALPRSRTAWISRFLTYGDWKCGHEELRHMRSLDDIQAWFSQPCIGAAETAGASWWRLLERFAPDARVLVVRRPVDEVVNSLMNIPGAEFDRELLATTMRQLDRKLDQVEARVPNTLSVAFEDLGDEKTCAAAFEHCLGLPHDTAHWLALTDENIQIDMPALMRYAEAYRPAMDKMVSIAKHQILSAMALRPPVEPAGITFQEETFEDWVRDGQALAEEHCVLVGEAPENWKDKNLPLMEAMYDVGVMQIMTARSNGRMFGYLVTLFAPSMVSKDTYSAQHTTFFASSQFPGLGLKLQRAALKALQARGINEVFFQANQRGSGPRLSTLYKRLGAQHLGQVYQLELAEA